MNLVCPICQAEYPLAAAMNDVAARQAVVKAFSLTQMGDRLIAYVALFKPAKQALSMVRLAKLLDGLVDMVKLGQIKKNGNTYAAPQQYWMQAIDQMLGNRQSLSLPLKNHNYLIAIIANTGEKVEAKKEADAEKGRQNGVFHSAQPVIASQHEVQARQSSNAIDCHAANAPRNDATQKPPRKAMPADVQATIRKMSGKTSRAN